MLDQYDIDAAGKRYAAIVEEMKKLRAEALRCHVVMTRFAMPYSAPCSQCGTTVYRLAPFEEGVEIRCQSKHCAD